LKEQLLRVQCRKFAIDGEQFSAELRDENLAFFTELESSHRYYSIALAIALTWTKHAKYEADFIRYAVGFFDSQDSTDASLVERFALRFGAESLERAMNGLRTFENNLSAVVPDFHTCDVKDIKKFQDKSLQRLYRLIQDSQVSGVGPWLFLGPIKVILGVQDRFWGDPNIDSIILPTGVEVNRGIRKLIANNSLLVKDFDPNWIVNEEGGLMEGFSNDQLIHNVLRKIAEIGETRVLHINSAFYLYGKEKG
jgi:hypothetical protein